MKKHGQATGMQQDNANIIQKALKRCRRIFLYAAGFSAAISVLSLATPLYSLQVYDRVLSSGSRETLLMLTIIIALTLVFLTILQTVRNFVFTGIGHWLDSTLSPKILQATVKLAATQKPLLGNQTMRDFNTIKQFVVGQPLQQLFDAPFAILFLIVVYFIHPILGLITTVSAIVLLGLAIYNDKRAQPLSNKANDDSLQVMKETDMITRHATVVEAMGMMGNLQKRFKTQQEKANQSHNQLNAISGCLSNITKSIRQVIQMVIMGVSALLVLKQSMSAGGIIAASIISGKALMPFDQSVMTWKSVLSAKKAYQRLKDLLEKSPFQEQSMSLPAPEGTITVENLAYTYYKSPVLNGISFQLSAGEYCGIIGPSAAGKSTLAKLLVGVYKPISGKVGLDSADIYQWNKEELGEYIGYLSQEIELFNGTIAENISRMSPEPDAEKVVQAAKLVHAHELILQLPQGYDTPIGVSGSYLSAGQRQRVALARAFYGSPNYVVLDEPNAYLDQAGDQALGQALDNAKKTKTTVIVISHRPAILQFVDKILVIKDGQVGLFGDRDDVLQKVMPSS